MEIETDKLAIVIPYYKITFFDKTLLSLQSQTDKRFTVYIGDDASPYSPDDLLKKYTGKFNFVYKKFEKNLGSTHLTKQWNRCIALSKNETWLMILGDDDTLQENAVEEFYLNLQKIEEQNIKVVRLASQLIDEQGNTISGVFTNPQLEDAATSYMRAFRGEGRSTLTEHFFTRKTYEKWGFKEFPVAFGSDNVAWLEFPEMKKIYSINKAKAFIRISSEHLSSKNEDGLSIRRREGIYLFNRYIISNYSKDFSVQDRFLILKKAYKNLTSSTRNKLRSIEFITFMTRYIPLSKIYQITKENRLR